MNTESTSSGPFGADPFQVDAFVATVMETVRVTEQEHGVRLVQPFGPRRFAVGLTATVLVLGGLYGLAASRSSGPGATPAAHATFHEAGLAFDYPASWTRSSAQGCANPGIAGSADLVFIGSGSGTATCTPMSPPVDGGGFEYRSFEAALEPDTLVARIEIDQRGIDNRFPDIQHWDIAAGGTRRIVVGGLPAFTGPSNVSHSALGANRVTTWVLSSLQDLNRHYQITVAMRGPDLASLQAQVDALLASVTFDPPANAKP
jgi:hypothetical protein